MPIYQRKCASCLETDEALESIHAPQVIPCPHCGDNAFEKQPTRTEFVVLGASYRNGFGG